MIMFVQSCHYLIRVKSPASDPVFSNVNQALLKNHLSLLAMMPKAAMKKGIVALSSTQCQQESKYFGMLTKANTCAL